MAKLFVIAGHGAGDPGACAGGYSEADLVRQLAARLKTRGGDEVIVGDTSVNWYASNYISAGKCPKGVPVIELHMDSAAASAKGGHVIIKNGLKADSIDNSLASFIGSFMPGRSQTLVGRSDLANPNRAARMGVNYRLMECGFITNEGDRSKFINQMDALAYGILTAFGITSNGVTTPSAPSVPAQPAAPSTSAPSTKLEVDGHVGPATVKELQSQLGTAVDGVISWQSTTDRAAHERINAITYGSGGSDVVLALQNFLRKKGYNISADRYLGKNTVTALQRWMRDSLGYKKHAIDGILGQYTAYNLQNALNAGAFRG